jgi:hypothetical protein
MSFLLILVVSKILLQEFLSTHLTTFSESGSEEFDSQTRLTSFPKNRCKLSL